MNKKDSKYNSDTSKEEQNKVEEPNVVYERNRVSENEMKKNIILNKLLDISLKQIENGEVRPHENVMKDMKKKFNFSF